MKLKRDELINTFKNPNISKYSKAFKPFFIYAYQLQSVVLKPHTSLLKALKSNSISCIRESGFILIREKVSKAFEYSEII